MTILKILFLLLIIIPFALFLLYVIDKLLDEMPSKSEVQAEMSAVERRRARAAANKGKKKASSRSHSKTRGQSSKPRSQGGTGRSRKRRSRKSE